MEFRACFGGSLPGAARSMRDIAAALPVADPARAFLTASAARYAEAALGHVVSVDYTGEHRLTGFAVYLLSSPPRG